MTDSNPFTSNFSTLVQVHPLIDIDWESFEVDSNGERECFINLDDCFEEATSKVGHTLSKRDVHTALTLIAERSKCHHRLIILTQIDTAYLGLRPELVITPTVENIDQICEDGKYDVDPKIKTYYRMLATLMSTMESSYLIEDPKFVVSQKFLEQQLNNEI